MLLLLLAACGPATPPVAPDPVTPDPVTPDPGPAIATPPPGCEVSYALTFMTDGDRVEVVALATNTTGAPVQLTLPERCPGSPIGLTGLPDGHDPDNTCVMGDCPGDLPPDLRTIEAGATATLARWWLDTQPSTCNPALAAGDYTLGFSPAAITTTATTCGPDEIVVAVGASPAPPPPAPKCAPMPACGIGCPGPMAKDEHGCTICACEKLDGPGGL